MEGFGGFNESDRESPHDGDEAIHNTTGYPVASALARLLEVARDRRYSDEFVGMTLRARVGELQSLLDTAPIAGE